MERIVLCIGERYVGIQLAEALGFNQSRLETQVELLLEVGGSFGEHAL